MIKIEAIVNEERFDDVLQALREINVRGLTVYQVSGCGVSGGWTEMVRGHKIELNLLPKVKFEIVVSDKDWADKTIKAVMDAARTGGKGAGKIFVTNLDQVIRISTGETGYKAINKA